MIMTQKAWITMFVVVWLEEKIIAEKEVWELVVEKARGWLMVQVGMGTDALEEKVRFIVNRK